MKLCVLIPSAGYRQNAGARIRYLRMAEPLRKLGVSLDLVPVADVLQMGLPDSGVFLVSKCFDAPTLAVMALARAKGRQVGVDLFDDYFSHDGDPRFARTRSWLEQALSFSTFITASTQPMADIGRKLAPQLPVHILNDPCAPLDMTEMAAWLEAKRAALAKGAPLRISWFGMGDNPQFPVGIADVAAFSGELACLRRAGIALELRILANIRSLPGETLAALRRLPLPCSLQEWSEDGEKTLLEQSHVAFLPVNAQRFSAAKSLNRALTALTSATQVLSSGYPLYRALGPFIYRDARELLADQKRGQPRLRPETLDAFGARLAQVADPVNEAASFAAFLRALPAAAAPGQGRHGHSLHGAVLHGRGGNAGVHEFARREGFLSAGTPLSPANNDYDIKLQWDVPGGLLLPLVHRRNRSLLVKAGIPFSKTGFLGLGSYLKPAPRFSARSGGCSLPGSPLPAAILPCYAHVLGASTRLLQTLLPGSHVIISEALKLPWQLPGGTAAPSHRSGSDEPQ